MQFKHDGIMDDLNRIVRQFEQDAKTTKPGDAIDIGPMVSYWVSKGYTDSQSLLSVACELRKLNDNLKTVIFEVQDQRARPLHVRIKHFFTGVPRNLFDRSKEPG